MSLVSKIWAKLPKPQGQSMTEYSLILAAVAIAVYSGYQSLGSGIGNTLGNITNSL
jgi:Flp pilus assembly pilin Flp